VVQADLPARQFRTETHDLHIASIAKDSVAFLGGKLFHDLELLEMADPVLTAPELARGPVSAPNLKQDSLLF
jgi:hypothetical protein